jgi:adenine-specific DNA-methyltransferase
MTSPRATIRNSKAQIRLAWPGKGDFDARPARSLVEVERFASDDGQDASRNLIICGDGRDALPPLLARFEHQVKLIYIDPPFATGQMFENYDDRYERSLWLNEMLETFRVLEKFLANDGTLWVHLDYRMSHYAKVMLDSLFTYQGFVGEVIWQKADSPRMDAKQFSNSHDYLLVYSPTVGWQPKKMAPPAEDRSFTEVDGDGRRFRTSPLRKWGKNSARADRQNLWYPISAPADIDHPDAGKEVWPIKPNGDEGNWRWERRRVERHPERLAWLDKGSGLQPYVIAYQDEQKKRPPTTLWLNTEVGHNREAKAHLKRLFGPTPFDTPKPERLLDRIIELATDEDDLVLDCFAGSGTTGAVAHKKGRRFILVERARRTAYEIAAERLRKVMTGGDRPAVHRPGACPIEECPECGNEIEHLTEPTPTGRRRRAPVNIWPGGFTMLEVGDAIARRDPDLGLPILSEEYRTPEALAELFCAYSGFAAVDETIAVQLGVEPGLFAAVKERRLVHFADAVVDAGYVDGLLERLPDSYNLIVYARRSASDMTLPERVRVEKTPRDFLDDLRLRPAEASWVAPVFEDHDGAEVPG